MSDHNEFACRTCGSYLHPESRCPSPQAVGPRVYAAETEYARGLTAGRAAGLEEAARMLEEEASKLRAAEVEAFWHRSISNLATRIRAMVSPAKGASK